MIISYERGDIMLDDIMIYFAIKLSEYCDDRNCVGCPFAPRNDEDMTCKIGTPAYWELKGVKK